MAVKILRAALVLAMAVACGPEGKVIDSEIPRSDGGYAGQCRHFVSAHKKELEKGSYRQATVTVAQWPVENPGQLQETALSTALAAGTFKRGVLYARGGLGKTKLAESLRAQLCGQLLVLIVDASAVAAVRNGVNGVIQVIDNTMQWDQKALAAQNGGRLLVLLDGLDELSPVLRPAVVTALADLPEKLPHSQWLVLARPPTKDADYGLTQLDARLSLEPLTALQADAVVAQVVPNGNERELFLRFLHRYGLDAQATSPTNNGYYFLATYRDINKLLAFYREATTANSPLVVSRSHVHEALCVERLHKELESLHWTPDQALALVDKMTAAQLRKAQNAALQFQFVDCEVLATGDAAAICERIFQSALFAGTPRGNFQFTAQGLADLFIARWLDREMGSGKPVDCKAALKYPDLLQAGDVFRFLVAQPNGLACVMPLLDDRCGRNPKSDQVEVLDDGLPIGRARQPIVKAMHAGYEATHWKYCTQKTLKSIDGTIASPGE